MVGGKGNTMKYLEFIKPVADILGGSVWGVNSEGRAINVMLIAPPESGKSSILEGLKGESVYELDDITSEALYNIPEGKHYLIIPEFQTVINRQKTSSPITKFLRFIEEGSTGKLTARDKDTTVYEERKFYTLIAGTTDDNWHKNEDLFKGTGFMSRLFTVFYRYLPSEEEAIRLALMRDYNIKPTIEIKVPENPSEVRAVYPKKKSKDAYELSIIFGLIIPSKRQVRNFMQFIEGLSRFREPDKLEIDVETVIDAFALLTYSTSVSYGNRLRYLMTKYALYDMLGIPNAELADEIKWYPEDEIAEEAKFVNALVYTLKEKYNKYMSNRDKINEILEENSHEV